MKQPLQTQKLQQESLDTEQAKFEVGASTSFFIIQYESFLAQATIHGGSGQERVSSRPARRWNAPLEPFWTTTMCRSATRFAAAKLPTPLRSRLLSRM